MCSEFKQKFQSGELITRFKLNEYPPKINIGLVRPTDQALIIGANNKAMFLSWGFKVAWDKKPIINARSETLTKKKTFQAHLGQRCIVPVAGYSEWRNDAGKKLKNYISPQAQYFFHSWIN